MCVVGGRFLDAARRKRKTANPVRDANLWVCMTAWNAGQLRPAHPGESKHRFALDQFGRAPDDLPVQQQEPKVRII